MSIDGSVRGEMAARWAVECRDEAFNAKISIPLFGTSHQIATVTTEVAWG